jgi:hypothetical protein
MNVHALEKPIWNRIRKFEPHSIIDSCVRLLHDPNLWTSGRGNKTPPWFLLLLIRWTYLQGDFLDYRKPPIPDHQFATLINGIHDMDGALDFDLQQTNVYHFLKRLAFQQFWLRRRIHATDLARQVVLFEESQGSDQIREMFLSATGVPLSEFLELSFALLEPFIRQDGRSQIPDTYFRTLEGHYGAEVLGRFLRLFARPEDEIRSLLKQESRDGLKKPEFRFYERTPLLRSPLLLIPGTGYTCFSPIVLQEAIRGFVYDHLKSTSRQRFTTTFGTVFEDYVTKVLDAAGVKYLTEKDLRKQLGSKDYIVDFLIRLPDRNLLLESKSVELNPLARVSMNPLHVERALEESVVKAVKQGIATAARLRETDGSWLKYEPTWLLIVSYKELYLGSGCMFLSGAIGEHLARWRDEQGITPDALPLENVYIASVDDLERLAGLASSGISIESMLDKAAENDRSAPTKKFVFGQHLEELGDNVLAPTFLGAAFERLAARVISAAGT